MWRRAVPLSRVWIPALPFIPLFKEAAAEMVCEYAAVEAFVLSQLIKITGSGTPCRTVEPPRTLDFFCT